MARPQLQKPAPCARRFILVVLVALVPSVKAEEAPVLVFEGEVTRLGGSS
jgi:hypothetical protein